MIILLALVVVGAAFAFAHWYAGKRKAQAKSWIAAPGRIVESRVDKRHDKDPDGTVTWLYRPTVRFTYAVDGVEHTGDRLAFSSVRTGNSKKAQAWCDRFPAGAEVTVFYDPNKPDDAVLDRG